MLPVSLNDLKGKNEGMKLRISDIFLKGPFWVIKTNSVQKCRKSYSRFSVYCAKIILALSNLLSSLCKWINPKFFLRCMPRHWQGYFSMPWPARKPFSLYWSLSVNIVFSFSGGAVLPLSTHLTLWQVGQEAGTFTFVVNGSFFVHLTTAAAVCSCNHSLLYLVSLHLWNKPRVQIHHFYSKKGLKISC